MGGAIGTVSLNSLLYYLILAATVFSDMSLLFNRDMLSSRHDCRFMQACASGSPMAARKHVTEWSAASHLSATLLTMPAAILAITISAVSDYLYRLHPSLSQVRDLSSSSFGCGEWIGHPFAPVQHASYGNIQRLTRSIHPSTAHLLFFFVGVVLVDVLVVVAVLLVDSCDWLTPESTEARDQISVVH